MTASNGSRPFTIVQISDLHCGGQYFLPNLLERAISELNDAAAGHRRLHRRPDDLRLQAGVRRVEALPRQARVRPLVVIPGNHDSRNVGYVHFERLFGDRSSVLRVGSVTIVAVDSTEPDLDHGEIGRGRYPWIEEQFAAGLAAEDLRPATTTCCRFPGTGRERNVVYDAGDAIECLQRAGVHLVLAATSTCRTPGGSRTCSSSTPAPSRRCGCAATPAPATT